MSISTADRTLLRELARQVADVAHLPIMAQRRALWQQHNALQPTRPLLLTFPEGSWGELLPMSTMRCEGEAARGIEWNLRHRLYTYAHFADDSVIEDEWVVSKAFNQTGWGLAGKEHAATTERGAWSFDPVIFSAADLKKLRFPEVTVDDAATAVRLAEAQELFGDLLTIKLKGVAHVSFHLMSLYTKWRGLEEVFMDMSDEPQMLHDAMAFLEAGYHNLTKQYVDLNLLSLNNDSTYHSSGGNGYTRTLPLPDFNPDRIRPCDMWASAETQELTPVSLAMHEEFAMQYEARLLAPFGHTGYGCCDDLTNKLVAVKRLPHMRRISISPFANVDLVAPQLKGDFIFSWKPQPSHLVGDFDAPMIRRYIQHTVDVARAHGCVLEIILKDTHTCQNHPERFDQWLRIARNIVGE